ncbi:MAG: HAMP domain-containing histidine kinase, partial [Deltaproteobacteria bacterium]
YRIDVVGMESDDTQKALEVDLFTSGIPISPKEALLIFEDGYKIAGDNTEGGSGHGLHFVNNIVHLHGGHAGCKPKENGNIFYIVLPKVSRPNKIERRDRS